MTARGLIVVGLLAFLLFTVIGMPASVMVPRILDAGSIGFGAAEGTLWRGRLEQASVRHTHLGRVEYDIHPLTLLTGAPEAGISLSGGDLQGSFVWQGGEGHRLSDLDLLLDASGRLGAQRFAGVFRISAGSFQFDAGGRCLGGKADIRTNMLQNAPGLNGPLLVGDLTCVSGQLHARLAGSMKDLTVAVQGALGASDATAFALSLTPAPGADIPLDLRQLLSLSGFTPRGDGSVVAQFELDVSL